jgi:hypothetical protein
VFVYIGASIIGWWHTVWQGASAYAVRGVMGLWYCTSVCLRWGCSRGVLTHGIPGFIRGEHTPDDLYFDSAALLRITRLLVASIALLSCVCKCA